MTKRRERKHNPWWNILLFIGTPLLYCAIAWCTLYFTLSPIIGPWISSMDMILAPKAEETDSKEELRSIFKEGGSSGESVPESEVQMPVYGTHYANLEIAAVSVKDKLYFGDSKAALDKGLGQYIGSSLPGYGRPILIGGHNNASFGKLQYVKVGDVVTITTSYGLFTYKITSTRIALDTDTSAYDLSQNKEQLILYTCYPFSTLGLTSKRFFVYADKVTGPAIISDSAD